MARHASLADGTTPQNEDHGIVDSLRLGHRAPWRSLAAPRRRPAGSPISSTTRRVGSSLALGAPSSESPSSPGASPRRGAPRGSIGSGAERGARVREGAVGHLGRRGARRSVARSGGRSVRQNGHLIASGLMSSAQYGQGVRASPASGSSSSCPSRRLPSAKRNAKAIRGEVMRLTKNQPKLLRRSRSA